MCDFTDISIALSLFLIHMLGKETRGVEVFESGKASEQAKRVVWSDRRPPNGHRPHKSSTTVLHAQCRFCKCSHCSTVGHHMLTNCPIPTSSKIPANHLQLLIPPSVHNSSNSVSVSIEYFLIASKLAKFWIARLRCSV